jgi:hypothetical protein
MAQNSRESAAGNRESQAIPEFRDYQQIRDDNQSSGESVVAAQTSGDATQPTDIPNQAANKEPADGSRETAGGDDESGAGGITNRPLEVERENQERVPPRGEAKGGGHA